MSFFFGAGDETRTRFRTPQKLCFYGGPAPQDLQKRGYTAFWVEAASSRGTVHTREG